MSIILATTQANSTETSVNESEQNYVPHGLIIVENNTDFNSNVWNGSGTYLDPYTIEGLSFKDNPNLSSIIIRNTNKHFIVLNCIFGGQDFPVVFENITNGIISSSNVSSYNVGIHINLSSSVQIINSNFTFSSYGVDIHNSTDIVIRGGSFSSTVCGVNIQSSNNVTISNSFFSNNLIGIEGFYSSNCLIVNNEVKNQSSSLKSDIDTQINDIYFFLYSGIILKLSHNFTITNNKISNNLSGIYLYSSYDSTITNNYFFNNTCIGIKQVDSHNITITSNLIQYDSILGIYIVDGSSFTYIRNNVFIMTNQGNYSIYLASSSTKNWILWNDLILNGQKTKQQAFDNGSSNTFTYNYWSEWLNRGYPEPYPIDGDVGNYDPFPQGSLINTLVYNPSTGTTSIEKGFFNNFGTLGIVTAAMIIFGVISFAVITKVRSNNHSSFNRDIKHHSKSISQLKVIEPSTKLEPSQTDLKPKSNTINKFYTRKNSMKTFIDVPINVPIKVFIISVLFKLISPLIIYNTPKEIILKNPIRKQIIQILKEKEIIHFNSLRQIIHCGSSVLSWHLSTLEHCGLIKSHTIGKYKVIYLTSMPIEEIKIQIYLNFYTKQALSFITKLLQSKIDFWTIKDLVIITQIPRRTISFYCKKLISLGILSYSKKIRYYHLENSKKSYLLWLINKY